MSEDRRQPICEPCYGVMFPTVEPERLPMEDFADVCAVCGRETMAGIWLTPAPFWIPERTTKHTEMEDA